MEKRNSKRTTKEDLDLIFKNNDSTPVVKDKLLHYIKATNSYLYLSGLSTGFIVGLIAMLALIALNNFLK